MIFYFNGMGTLIKSDPETLYQGSNKANKIYFVAPFSPTNQVVAQFTLPNGEISNTPLLMTSIGAINGVKLDGEEKDFAIWFAVVPKDLTTYYGNLVCQFNVYDGTGEIATTEAVNIKVARGSAPALPSAPTSSIYNQLTTALSNLTGRVANLEEWQDFFADTPNIVYGNNSNGEKAKIPFSENAFPSTIPMRTEQGTLKTATATKDSEAVNFGQAKKIASEAPSLLIEQELGNAADKTISQKVITENLNKKLDKTGGTVTGDLAISGNLTVDGKTIISEETTEVVKNAVIILNSDGTDLGTKLAGTVIRINSNATNNAYAIAYDPASESVKLGIGTVTESGEGESKTYTFVFASGEGAPVAVRADSSLFTDGHLIKWDSAKLRLVDSGKTVDDIGTGFDKATGIIFPYGTPSVTYDTTDGMTISATFRVTANGANFDIPCDFTIPIFPGENVSIDANEENDGIKVNLDGGTAADLQEVLKVVPHTAALAVNTSNTKVVLDNVNPSTEIFGSEYGTIFTHKRKWNGKLYDEGFNQLLNKADFPATQTIDGVTFTNNGDGTITVNGTAETNSIEFVLMRFVPKLNNKYLLSGCPAGGNVVKYYLASTPSSSVDSGSGRIFTYSSDNISSGTVKIWMSVYSDITVANLTFKPQLIDLTYFENATGKTINTVEDFQKLYPDFYDYVPLPSPDTPLEIVPSGSKSNIVTKSVNMLRKEKYTITPPDGYTLTIANDGALLLQGKSNPGYYQIANLGIYNLKKGHHYLLLSSGHSPAEDSADYKYNYESYVFKSDGPMVASNDQIFIWNEDTEEVTIQTYFQLKFVSIMLPEIRIETMLVDLTELGLDTLSGDSGITYWKAHYKTFYEGIEKSTTINYTAVDSTKQSFINNTLSLNGVISERMEKSIQCKFIKLTLTGTESGLTVMDYGLGQGSILDVPVVEQPYIGTTTSFSGKWVLSNMYQAQNVAPPFLSNGGISAISSIIINDANYTTVDAWRTHLAELYAAGTPLIIYYAIVGSEFVEIEEPEAIPVIGGQPNIIESQDIGVTNAPVIMDFTNYITDKLNKAYGLLKDNEGNIIVPYGQTNMLFDPNTSEYLSDLLPSKCNVIHKKDTVSGYYFDDGSITEIKRLQTILVEPDDPMWANTSSGTWGIGTLTIGNPSTGEATTNYRCIVSCSGIQASTGKLRYIVREVFPATNPTTKSVRAIAADGTVAWEAFSGSTPNAADFKTLFGNQSIVGDGNIDIYEHDIVISGDLTEALLTVYSSKNLKVDSLTDLKTLCGDTFKKACSGRANSISVYGITEANLLLTDGTTSTLANLTFTDTVMTI